ncbi:hypothetical protein B0H34DRAFT_456936 [Crassisporium funariophilum]|nr:hypothetical protein B0H34DRAFT_456936 [Crassisporium funariophilum]
MSAHALTPPFTPHTPLGVMVVGLGVAAIFYGITSLQTVHYFRRFQDDYPIVKFGVAVVWILETVNTCLAIHVVLHVMIVYRTTGLSPKPSPWSLPLQAASNATIAGIIYGLFSWRIWILSERNWIPIAVIAVAGSAQFVAGCAVTTLALGNFPCCKTYLRPTVLVSFALTAFTDVIISACLCYYLHVRKTGNAVSGSLLNRVIILTINNGILSSAMALTGCIASLVAPRTSVSSAMCFILGKAYFNTLLSTLNARKNLREKLRDGTDQIGLETVRKQLKEMGYSCCDSKSGDCYVHNNSSVKSSPECARPDIGELHFK